MNGYGSLLLLIKLLLSLLEINHSPQWLWLDETVNIYSRVTFVLCSNFSEELFSSCLFLHKDTQVSPSLSYILLLNTICSIIVTCLESFCDWNLWNLLDVLITAVLHHRSSDMIVRHLLIWLIGCHFLKRLLRTFSPGESLRVTHVYWLQSLLSCLLLNSLANFSHWMRLHSSCWILTWVTKLGDNMNW